MKEERSHNTLNTKPVTVCRPLLAGGRKGRTSVDVNATGRRIIRCAGIRQIDLAKWN